MTYKCLFAQITVKLFTIPRKKLNFWYHFNFYSTVWKGPKYGVFSGPYFPAFRLNTEQNSVRMWENADQKNSVFGHFSHSYCCSFWFFSWENFVSKQFRYIKLLSSFFLVWCCLYAQVPYNIHCSHSQYIWDKL